jgi:hypothetical protein
LKRLRALLRGVLAATAALWGPVEAAYAWVFRAAAVLANAPGLTGAAVKASYRGLLGAMARHAEGAGELAGALGHFRPEWAAQSRLSSGDYPRPPAPRSGRPGQDGLLLSAMPGLGAGAPSSTITPWMGLEQRPVHPLRYSRSA